MHNGEYYRYLLFRVVEYSMPCTSWIDNVLYNTINYLVEQINELMF